MSQIFVSHSKRDDSIVNYFGKLFGTTRVKGIFKEIEGFKSRPYWNEVQNDVQQSAAIFILLGPNIQNLFHTRDWTVWESATASAIRKDIWVFEPYEYLGKINVIIPHVDHYMIYQETNQYQNYIRKVIESYDDADILPSTLRGTFVGGAGGFVGEVLIGKGKKPPLLGPAIGAIIGGFVAAMAADPSRNRPYGIQIKCLECESTYQIHMKMPEIRCPICNAILNIDWDTYEKRYAEQ